eukprot:maker-scaffold_21-snap-gene-2.4-mRNA-1 protein AED:0.18 eAED:0.18 QI:49/0.5/0.33/1/0/0/3/0/394
MRITQNITGIETNDYQINKLIKLNVQEHFQQVVKTSVQVESFIYRTRNNYCHIDHQQRSNKKKKNKEMNNKYILLTGSAGFIGNHILNYLLSNNKKVISIDYISYCSTKEENLNQKNHIFYKRSITNEKLLSKIFSTYVIEGVIHAAASSSVDRSFMSNHTIEFSISNYLGTHILLNVCKNYNIKYFFYISTDEIYGENMNENSFFEEDGFNPTNPYSASKAGAEILVKSYFHSYNLPIFICRSNNVFGPKQYPEKVIPKFILQMKEGKKLSVMGSGKNKRSFLYVDDFVSAVFCIIQKGKFGEVYNIGSEKKEDEKSVLEIGENISYFMNKKYCVEYKKDRKYNDKRYLLNCEKLRSLGWKKEVSFEEGMEKTIKWYLNTDMKQYFESFMGLG